MATLTFPVPSAIKSKLVDDYERTGVKIEGKTYRYKRGRHGGIDIPARKGAELVACYPGRIVFPKWGSAYGNHFLIANSNGVGWLYAHCTAVTVSEGTYVLRGDRVGTAGDTGNASGVHLHFEEHPDYRDWETTRNPYPALTAAQGRRVKKSWYYAHAANGTALVRSGDLNRVFERVKGRVRSEKIVLSYRTDE